VPGIVWLIMGIIILVGLYSKEQSVIKPSKEADRPPALPITAPALIYTPPTHPVLPHLLLCGNPGTGKTALSRVVANELTRPYGYTPRFLEFTPLVLREEDAIDAIMMKMINYGTVLFLDEVHSLPSQVEESLYSVMTDGVFSGKYGTFKIPPFTLIGGTTKSGLLQKPFRDRFTLELELTPTTQEDLVEILRDQEQGIPAPTNFSNYYGQTSARMLLTLHIMALSQPEPTSDLTEDVKRFLAQRSLGSPRLIKQLHRHVIAYQKVMKNFTTLEAEVLMGLLGIDSYGLHTSDRRVITALLKRGNKPIGVKALAGTADVSPEDLVEVIEQRMVYAGMLEKGPRGRVLTPQALEIYQAEEEKMLPRLECHDLDPGIRVDMGALNRWERL
jgi:Holliday junction DNA helicase RuvB